MALPFSVTKSPRLSTARPNHFMDLRQEVSELFYGANNIPGVSFEVILRSVDKTQRCFCWDFIKNEADPKCPRCSGSGWLVYDRTPRTVKRKYVGLEELEGPGMYQMDSTLFFFEHTVAISHSDVIIEVVTDDMGKISSPVKFLKTHNVKDVEPLRFSNGRVEFYKVFASKAE